MLEIGAFHGFMSATIGRALFEVWGDHEKRLRIIDNFHDYRTSPEKLSQNLEVCEVPFELSQGTTETLSPMEGFDLAVIDGDHSYEWAWRDTQFAIASGAYMLLWHDSHSFEGVRLAVDHIRSRPGWGVVELPFDAGYALAIERFDAGPADVPADRSYVP